MFDTGWIMRCKNVKPLDARNKTLVVDCTESPNFINDYDYISMCGYCSKSGFNSIIFIKDDNDNTRHIYIIKFTKFTENDINIIKNYSTFVNRVKWNIDLMDSVANVIEIDEDIDTARNVVDSLDFSRKVA